MEPLDAPQEELDITKNSEHQWLKDLKDIDYGDIFVEFLKLDVNRESSEQTKNDVNRVVLKVVFEKPHCDIYQGLQISMDVDEKPSTESDGSKPGKLVAKLLKDVDTSNISACAFNIRLQNNVRPELYRKRGSPAKKEIRCSIGRIFEVLSKRSLYNFNFANIDSTYRGCRDYM